MEPTATVSSFLAIFWLLLCLLQVEKPYTQALNFTRADFPDDFVFGAGSSAYQIEGAVAEDGRTPSIWDTYTHAGAMVDKSIPDVTSDGYHKYKEDVKLIADTGLEAYRFSISWSRLIPKGRGDVNPKGLEYYNNLIDELVNKGVQLHVTLNHLDLPQILEDEYNAWLSPRIIEDFTAYADVCFREFGNRVSHWTTVVEPNVVTVSAYGMGAFPPSRCSNPFGFRKNCTVGDSTVEPYIANHNHLLAHASVARLYREKYQAAQKGFVGINIYSYWCYPNSNSPADVQATERALDFLLNWDIHPLVFGDYPDVMKKNVGSRLPKFSKSQRKLIRGAVDFIGLNHYTSVYISDDARSADMRLRDYYRDMSVKIKFSKNDTPSGSFLPEEIHADPEGLRLVLEYLRDTYGNIPLYVQENGYEQKRNGTVQDTARIDYLSGYMGSTLAAIRNGVDVRGYFVWSFMDVWEFLSGYQSRYGLYYVDFNDDKRQRQPKLSAHWYANFLKTKNKVSMMADDIDSGSSSI